MSNVIATTYNYLGGQFQIGNGGSPETFTTVTQVKDVDFTGSKVDTQDITTADNTDGTRRFVDTLFDAGECTATIFWNPNDVTHQQLESAFLARGTHNFKRINPGGFGTRSFAGIIVSIDRKEAIDKPTEATVKIKLNGAYTDSLGA